MISHRYSTETKRMMVKCNVEAVFTNALITAFTKLTETGKMCIGPYTNPGGQIAKKS